MKSVNPFSASGEGLYICGCGKSRSNGTRRITGWADVFRCRDRGRNRTKEHFGQGKRLKCSSEQKRRTFPEERSNSDEIGQPLFLARKAIRPNNPDPRRFFPKPPPCALLIVCGRRLLLSTKKSMSLISLLMT